jgi:3-oxoacyl-[acyl-carrier protein] reductase
MKPQTDVDPPFVAVVTGSSSGIGQAVAIELARRGAHVLVHARSNLHGLATTVHAIEQELTPPKHQHIGRKTRSVIADISDEPSARGLVQAAFAWYGYVHVWVHAAGADVLTGSAKRWSFAQKLRELWSTDVYGTILLSRLVADRMMQSPLPELALPSMVHIGWDQANQGMEGDSGQYFCPVKSAVEAFSKSLAKSYAPRLRVNCILPGWIKTEWGDSASPEWHRRATGESLLQRWGSPQDVANIIAAISMGDGAFINGQSIAVNGGWCGNGQRIEGPSS